MQVIDRRSGEAYILPDDWFERGTIYFVGCGQWVKIGFATKLDMRLKALQAANPEPLTVLHSVDGTMQTEREFHKRFSALRGTGEWFKNEGDLAAWLKEQK